MRAVSGEAARIATRSTPVSPRPIASSTANCSHSPESWLVCSGSPVAINVSSARMRASRASFGSGVCACAESNGVNAQAAARHTIALIGVEYIFLLLSKGRTSAQTRKRSVFFDGDPAGGPGSVVTNGKRQRLFALGSAGRCRCSRRADSQERGFHRRLIARGREPDLEALRDRLEEPAMLFQRAQIVLPEGVFRPRSASPG